MARHLKSGRSAEQSAQDATKVQDTVRKILADIESRGDQALVEYSTQFDNWRRSLSGSPTPRFPRASNS